MNKLLKFMAALAPSTLLLLVLFQIFPNTGLGRIITTPLIYILNIGMIGLGFLLVHLLRPRYSIGVWIVIGIATLFITVWFYPQESQPHIIRQVLNAFEKREGFLFLNQVWEKKGIILFWTLTMGITVSLIGWFFLVKNIPGSLIGSLLAGIIGALSGNHFFEYMGMYGWYRLIFAFIMSCALVILTDLMIRSAKSQ